MEKRILILMGGGSKHGVGEQYINGLVKNHPNENIFRYLIVNSNTDKDLLPEGQNIEISQHHNSSLPIISSISQLYFQKSKSDRERILTKIAVEKIDILWVILNSGQLIHLAHTLLPDINCKLIIQIWDDPDYLLKSSRLDIIYQKILLKKFNDVASKSNHIVAISEGMAEKFGKKFSKPTSYIYFTTPLNTFPPLRNRERQEEELNVIFAGSLYAYKEWKSFLQAVEFWNKEENKPRIKVTFMGTPSKWTYMPSWVIKLPNKPVGEAIDIVSTADVAYLPYWMDSRYSETVKSTFPSKLSFYTAAGTPIFYHGPKNSSPNYFLEKNPVGLYCNSLNKDAILDILNKVNNNQYLCDHKKYNDLTFNENFHPRISSYKFNKILNDISE